MSAQAQLEQFTDEPTLSTDCSATSDWRAVRASKVPNARTCAECYPNDTLDTEWVLLSTTGGKVHRSVDEGTAEGVTRNGGPSTAEDDTALLKNILQRGRVESFDLAHRVRDHPDVESCDDVADVLDDIVGDDRGQLHAPEYIMVGLLAFLFAAGVTILVVMGGGL